MTKHGPDFLILGAMKSGTSTLSHYLMAHPDVCWPAKKELHYYDRLETNNWTLSDYRNQFPKTVNRQITGESTPVYLCLPDAPAQVARDFPDIKLLIILRDPIERAYSHYIQRATKGREPRNFEAVIEIEASLYEHNERVFSSVDAVKELSYLARGLYEKQIRNWQAHFPKNRFHIMFLEDLKSGHVHEIQKVFAHLELKHCTITNEIHAHKRTYSRMSDIARSKLKAFFQAPDDALEAMLERRLPWR